MTTDFNKILEQTTTIIASGDQKKEILQAVCKLLKSEVYHYDWVGFYLPDASGSMLILEAFNGKPTEHTTIPIGKGVCGQVAQNKKLKVVQEVSKEDNYIACSIDVQSEIVVPIISDGKFLGEIDIDSHSFAPFSIDDEIFLTAICLKLSFLF